MPKKVYYNGDSQVIQALCQTTNDIIDSGGGGGSVVTITPTISTGTKTADYTINGNAGELYAPTPPTKTSDLNNDSGFITSSDLPTKTSDLTNDSGFVASSDVAIIKDANNDITTTLTLADNKVTFNNNEILLDNVTLKSSAYGSIAQTVIEGNASNAGEMVALKAWNNIASGTLSMSGHSFDVEIGDKTLLPSPRVYTPSVTISGADVSVLCDVDGDDNPNTITFPKKSGTVALTSDIVTDASGITYDNTTSGLAATDAQTAIDELALKHGTVTDTLVNIFADVLTTANLYKKTGKVLIDDTIYDISLVSNRVFATTNRCGSNTILTDSYLYNNGSMTRYLGRATTGGNTIESQSVDADATGTLIY